MKVEYHRRYSPALGREMEFKVFGHGGKAVFVFPCQNGRFFDYADFGMVEGWRERIEAGRVTLFCLDSMDAESWSDLAKDAGARVWRQEEYFRYIIDEMVPAALNWSGISAPTLMATGNSLGGLHAAICHLRCPDRFDTSLSLSGLLDSRLFFGDWTNQVLALNSPCDLLENLGPDDDRLHLLRQGRFVAAIGQGRWEGDLLPSHHRMHELLARRQVPGWIDFWGYDVDHDWPWWHRMLAHHLDLLLPRD